MSINDIINLKTKVFFTIMENACVKNQAGNRKKAKHCKFEISVSFNECWLKNFEFL